jgi:hypothetical protein
LEDEWSLRGDKGELQGQFKDVAPFAAHGLAAAQAVDRKWGFIDLEGQWVVRPRYGEAKAFAANGLAAVLVAEIGRWGFINVRGDWEIAPAFEAAESFDERGQARAKAVGGGWGFLGRSGEWAIQPRFEALQLFSANGLAGAANEKGRWGFVNQYGDWVVEARFGEVRPFGDGDRAVVLDLDDGLYGFVNPRGDWLPESKFAQVGPFVGGLAAAKLAGAEAKLADKDALWGFIDEQGRWVVKPQFKAAEPFAANGLALVETKDGSAFVDRDGNLMETKFKQAGSFSEAGLAGAMGFVDSRWGFVDNRGEWRIEPNFWAVGEFAACSSALRSAGR